MSEEKRLAYLIQHKYHRPEIYFKLPNEIQEHFQWTDNLQTKWRYKNYDAELGKPVRYSDCPILGIYDPDNNEHLERMVTQVWDHKSIVDDFSSY